MEKIENREINNTNVSIVSGKPVEIITEDKKNLPKIVLARGERFNVSLKELRELYYSYYETISEMKEGTAFADAELQSKMNSALGLTFDEEIERLRLKNARLYAVERRRQIMLNSTLTPCTWRNWWWLFKKHKNQAQILLEERVRREAAIDIKNQEDTLPKVPNGDEGEEEEQLSFIFVLQTLFEALPHMRKKRKGIILELLQQLGDVYDSKVSEHKQTAEELEEVKGQLKQEQERIIELIGQVEELTAALMTESEPARDDPEATETEEQNATEGGGTPEEAEESTEETEETPADSASVEEEHAETANEGEEDGLYYGELDDSDE